MLEFLVFCFAPANFFYTLLLILLVLYWTGVILGALDLGLGTPDVDFDLDADADIGADAGTGAVAIDLDLDPGAALDHDLDAHQAPPWLAFLRFFNIGEVPLMIYLSFFIPCAWLLSLAATEALGWAGSWLAGLALLAPVFFFSAFAAKFATWPFRKLFRSMNREIGLVNREPILGREAVVLSLEVDDSHGQAEIRGRGAPILLNVRAAPGRRFARNDKVRLTALLDDERDVYLIDKG